METYRDRVDQGFPGWPLMKIGNLQPDQCHQAQTSPLLKLTETGFGYTTYHDDAKDSIQH